MNPDQIKALHKDLDGLTETEIKARLARGVWRSDKVPFIELYLEEKEKARHLRFTEGDRTIQRWILAIAAATFVVSLLGLIYAVSY